LKKLKNCLTKTGLTIIIIIIVSQRGVSMERMSKQRNGILEILSQKNYHPGAEEIYSRLKKRFPKLGIATVYRNLEQLTAAGVIVKINMAGEAARFDGFPEKHYHITCTVCGRVEDVWCDFKLMEKNNFRQIIPDFEVTEYSIDFQGRCRSCREKEKMN